MAATPPPARRLLVPDGRRARPGARLLRLAEAMQAPVGGITHVLDLPALQAGDLPLLRATDTPADPTWPPARGRR